jgi:hypothetical protein
MAQVSATDGSLRGRGPRRSDDKPAPALGRLGSGRDASVRPTRAERLKAFNDARDKLGKAMERWDYLAPR